MSLSTLRRVVFSCRIGTGSRVKGSVVKCQERIHNQAYYADDEDDPGPPLDDEDEDDPLDDELPGPPLLLPPAGEWATSPGSRRGW